MNPPGISQTYLLLIILSLLPNFTLPQSQNDDTNTLATPPSNPPTIPLPPHTSSLIIPASTFSPDATSSYLITFTPASPPNPPLPPLSHDAINYCFSRLTILASRHRPRAAPFSRPLICTVVDCEVIVKPVAAWVMNYGELDYLLGEVGAWVAGRGGEEKGWDQPGVQRWYRSSRGGQRVEIVEVVVGRTGGHGVGGGTGGKGVGGGVDVDG